jgi:hypothetical protein
MIKTHARVVNDTTGDKRLTSPDASIEIIGVKKAILV